jgi:hypothetical protein
VIESYGLTIEEIPAAHGERLLRRGREAEKERRQRTIDERRATEERRTKAIQREAEAKQARLQQAIEERRAAGERHAQALLQVNQIIGTASLSLPTIPDDVALEFADLLEDLTLEEQVECMASVASWIRTHPALSAWFGFLSAQIAKLSFKQRKSLLQMMPIDMISQRQLWFSIESLPAHEVTDLLWDRLHTNATDLWFRLSLKVKVFCIYRAAQTLDRPLALEIAMEQLADEPAPVQFALRILSAQGKPGASRRAFAAAHKVLEDWITETAFVTTAALDLEPLLPPCLPRKVPFCEGRPWPTEDDTKDGTEEASRIWCSRAAQECLHFTEYDKGVFGRLSGARVYPRTKQPWAKWSILELLDVCGVSPSLPRLKADEYVAKVMSGWVNRINEIRPRLKCSVCSQIMIPDARYAKNFAVYGVTVMNCPGGLGHDRSVYFSHCWACQKLIDNRESRIRHEEYFLCIYCGSGKQHSPTFAQGDICPLCGAPNMDQLENLRWHCQKCSHEIILPRPSARTGRSAGDRRKIGSNFPE